MPTSEQESQRFQKSYRKGLPLLLYGGLWLGAMLGGFWLISEFFGDEGSLVSNLLIAALMAALAGGIGGVAVLLHRLQRHIATEQNFNQQSALLYVGHPFIGVLAGALAMLLIALPCGLLMNFASTGQLFFAESFSSSTFIALIVLLAWCAAFYQQHGFEKAAAKLKDDEEPAPPEELLPRLPIPIDADSPLSFKDWYIQQQHMRRWSFTWGFFLLLYGVVWLIGALVAYNWSNTVSTVGGASQSVADQLIVASWPVAIAGAVGGVVCLFTTLYEHISNKQDFHRQHVMAYLVQPMLGLIFGWSIYFFVASGYLIVNAETIPSLATTPSLAMLEMVVGWAVGFRQNTISPLVLTLIQDIVVFFKLVGKLIYPMTLFNKEERDKVLAEIKTHTRLFKPVEHDDTPTSISGWPTPE